MTVLVKRGSLDKRRHPPGWTPCEAEVGDRSKPSPSQGCWRCQQTSRKGDTGWSGPCGQRSPTSRRQNWETLDFHVTLLQHSLANKYTAFAENESELAGRIALISRCSSGDLKHLFCCWMTTEGLRL